MKKQPQPEWKPIGTYRTFPFAVKPPPQPYDWIKPKQPRKIEVSTPAISEHSKDGGRDSVPDQ